MPAAAPLLVFGQKSPTPFSVECIRNSTLQRFVFRFVSVCLCSAFPTVPGSPGLRGRGHRWATFDVCPHLPSFTPLILPNNATVCLAFWPSAPRSSPPSVLALRPACGEPPLFLQPFYNHHSLPPVCHSQARLLTQNQPLYNLPLSVVLSAFYALTLCAIKPCLPPRFLPFLSHQQHNHRPRLPAHNQPLYNLHNYSRHLS